MGEDQVCEQSWNKEIPFEYIEEFWITMAKPLNKKMKNLTLLEFWGGHPSFEVILPDEKETLPSWSSFQREFLLGSVCSSYSVSSFF